MYDPDMYDSYSEFQRRDAAELVPYMVSKMNWRKAETVLDFGCGSGFNTKNILLPTVNNFLNRPIRMHIHGIDVSKKMIDFAAVKYTHPDITYMVADVMKDDCEFPCKFDKIFSFHVLHWILDQRKALNHLYTLLKNNGEISLYFIANAAVFSVYDSMSNNPTWAPYLSDVKNFIPKSYFSIDPAKDMYDMMTSIGYNVHESKNCTRKFAFDCLDDMVDAAMAANPFIHRIPCNLQSEYKDDFRNCFLPFLHHVPRLDAPSAIEVDYDIVLVRAKRA